LKNTAPTSGLGCGPDGFVGDEILEKRQVERSHSKREYFMGLDDLQPAKRTQNANRTQDEIDRYHLRSDGFQTSAERIGRWK